jgi:hypothetical protein
MPLLTATIVASNLTVRRAGQDMRLPDAAKPNSPKQDLPPWRLTFPLEQIKPVPCKSPSLLFVAVGVSVPTTRMGRARDVGRIRPHSLGDTRPFIAHRHWKNKADYSQLRQFTFAGVGICLALRRAGHCAESRPRLSRGPPLRLSQTRDPPTPSSPGFSRGHFWSPHCDPGRPRWFGPK